MAELILNNIGNFLQDSCLSYCLIHTVEQVSYINISPHDVENRFLCIQCYQSEQLNKEEKDYIISLRLFLQKQLEKPHFQILSEDIREQVQETLQTKGKVNLREKIKEFNANLIEIITEELNAIFKAEDEKTQLINEKLQSLFQKFGELNNASEIYDIFYQNKSNIDELNTKLDNYIKLAYLKANQLKEGSDEYEELFDEFNLDQAEFLKEKVLKKIKQIHYYTPQKNRKTNSLVDKSIFEEEAIYIDDSSLTLKSKSFLKLLHKIPSINSQLINQIEKQLIMNPIFEDIDFEIDEEENDEEQQQELGQPQLQNEGQVSDRNNQQIETQTLENVEKGNQNLANQFEDKQMNIQESISPIQKPKQKLKSMSKKQNQESQKGDITEQELTQFINNALNDDIPFNHLANQHKKNYSRCFEQPINQSQQVQGNRHQYSQNFSNIYQSTPPMFINPQNKQETYYQSHISYQNQSNNYQDTTYQTRRIPDQKEFDSNDNFIKEQFSQIQTIKQLPFQQDQSSTQVYPYQSAIIQQNIEPKFNQTLQQMNQESSNGQNGQSSQSKYPNLYKHQSANYENYFKNQQAYNQEINSNNINLQKVQSKSRDQSPSSQFSIPIQNNKDINKNGDGLLQKQLIKEDEDENKMSVGAGSSGFTFKEVDDAQLDQNAIEQNKQPQKKGLLQIDSQSFNLQMKKSKLGSSEKVEISHQSNNTIIIQSPTDSYAHYVISKDVLEPNKEYIFLFSIKCQKNDSILIGITPKEFINEKVLHKFPYYKSFINTNLETFSKSCEKIEKGTSIRITDDNCIHVVMRVCIQNQVLVFYDYPKMENVNSIKNPTDLKDIRQYYLTVGFTRSKESFNNPQSNPLRIQILDMRIADPTTLGDLINFTKSQQQQQQQQQQHQQQQQQQQQQLSSN
ncbi:hypothetical protein TTHERM_00388380 (macronuclear) [Tetrahymena thermophila SB210]|uniref:Uncharacterized protein n=1 Tax=Tetrahymena thermophila (strain SB210) TaxID=312017 RepID=Q23RF1_TETTS|nr:hypothetical protein TTHERM_00388380 [Tetrahymena thermophila SB210]EAR99097.1 hypothetical protein TTHERM_00388380 [Tetrahymena thermophila SB210]|eukprot:XP_001019342.1 hypothetical protein TTHERM_00388380 [Tetrahymena thermophila SB210]